MSNNNSQARCVICGKRATVIDVDEQDIEEYADAIGLTGIGAGESIYDETVLHVMMHDECITAALECGTILEIKGD